MICQACLRDRHDACIRQVSPSVVRCACIVCWGDEDRKSIKPPSPLEIMRLIGEVAKTVVAGNQRR